MRRESNMATRNPIVPGRTPGDTTTEFQLHKSQNANTNQKTVLDYTEHRLRKFIEVIDDPQQKATMVEVLSEYIKGHVAVAWKGGRAVWFAVTREHV